MITGNCRILRPWPDWNTEIHAEPAQLSRQRRAMNYPFTFRVNHKACTARFSSTSDLPYYDTSLSQCSCYDFQGRLLPCKHIYRLAAELGVIEIISRASGGYSKEQLAEIAASDDIDGHPEQKKRLKSAEKTKLISIDYKKQTAIFKGSGQLPYETSLDSCTCRDFFVRKLPCKHIYRLRMELDSHTEEAIHSVCQ